MVLEAFGQALLNLASLELWVYIVAGSVLGIIIGIIPGIGSVVGLAIVLPFVFLLPQREALALMVAMCSGSYTGGSITSILLNVPGSSVNAATLLDGYPMSKKGEAGRALGAAIGASTAGGVLTVLYAFAMVPLVIPLVYALRSADMVFLVLLGIAFIAVLTEKSATRALIAGVLGLMISLIGVHITTGVPRFTGDIIYLFDGLPLAAVVLGLFAIPEMIVLAAGGGTIARGTLVTGVQGALEGVKDVFRHWWLFLRCSVIGYLIGVIPGIGATAAVFIAYAHAKQTSGNPEEFGTGRVEGVVAPETANNAKEAGSLLTTLAFGIPGSAEGAFFLGAFLIMGITPGPEMITKYLPLSLTLFLIIIIGNLLAGAICFALATRLAKICLIPSRILVPICLMVIFVGVYVGSQKFNDLVVALAFGALGLAMIRFGFSRPALLLGFVLGKLFEKYLFISIGVDGPLFWARPISIALILMIAGVIAYNPLMTLLKHLSGKGVKEVWIEKPTPSS
ncbi:MAG: tripartite tricarboxylate transporter permease [Chloroflexi bacterium]|nr:tripartite tricarboxylate transporter permease [Chloroflexota bacterium]